MFSTVQAIFLFDVNSLAATCKSESELEHNVAKLKLGCLKLLTEFGAQTENGTDDVRWSCKYYDSCNFKPGTNRRDFVDFNKKSFDDLDNDLTDRFCKAFDSKQTDSDKSTSSNETVKPHHYTLNKALQEVLQDYNWDVPVISSPVKSVRRKAKSGHTKLLPENVGPYNTVIVYTNVPHNLPQVWEFCGSDKVKAEDFLDSFLDQSMVKGFQEEHICLNFVNLGLCLVDKEVPDPKVTQTIQSGLAKLNGRLHSISNIAQNVATRVTQYEVPSGEWGLFPSPSAPVAGVGVQVSWWRKARSGRPRKPQPGPTLVWEDAQGTSYLKVHLELLAVHGR